MAREKTIIAPGTAFEVIRRMLSLNPANGPPLVEVILLSRSSPDLSLRAFHSIEHYGLTIKHGSFTSGRSVSPFLKAWEIDLFLSNEAADVRAAVAEGTAAARLYPPPAPILADNADEVRFAFDGDAVLFDAESDRVYAEKGLVAFLEHESLNASTPMKRGPFGQFLVKLATVRKAHLRPDGTSRVRIALVTARNAPAHTRVIQTFRAWGTPADEAHFVGRREKAPVLQATGAHIYFDDQEKHVLGAAPTVASGHVPGPHDPAELVLPAG